MPTRRRAPKRSAHPLLPYEPGRVVSFSASPRTRKGFKAMFKLVRYASLVVVFAAGLAVVAAQEDEKVTVNANLVTVNVSVTDSRGRHVSGLTGEKFEVFADGVKQ